MRYHYHLHPFEIWPSYGFERGEEIKYINWLWQYKNALKTAVKLAEYENEIDPSKIFSLLAIAAYYAENYQYCSRAFVKLKGSSNLI